LFGNGLIKILNRCNCQL